jgi:hypothetical protein
MVIVRPPGQGRNARARQRKLQNENTLLHAPFLHGNTQPGRWKVLDVHLVTVLPSHGLAVDIGMGNTPCTTLEFACYHHGM